jgi:hypothetical protein
MDLPADWSTWVRGLDDVRICSDEVVDGSREITVEAKRGDTHVVMTFEVDPDSDLLNAIRETSDEVPALPEGEETNEYIDAPTYFNRLFREASSLGEIDLPSGYIAVISPDQFDVSWSFPIERLKRRVAPGKYPLDALKSGERAVGYRILFSKKRAVTYRDAVAKPAGSDVATMLWLDATRLQEAEDCGEDLLAASTGIRVLDDGTTVGVTATGADGAHPLVWGLDEHGDPACLVLDVWFDAPRESLDRTIVVKDRLPPDLLEVGLKAERDGEEIVLVAPDAIQLSPEDPRPRTHSRNCATAMTRMGFRRGEQVRVSWRGRKLV